jgi:LmbE family N-acetylglucosaminyl deacetylase
MSRPALLTFGAHPDDAEIGAFGSLLRWRDSFEIHLVLATAGEQGLPDEQDRACRVGESERAAEILGADVTCLGLPDGYLRDDLGTVQQVAEVIRRVQPQRVLVNHVEDTHQDHRYLARAVLAASREVPEVLLYETPGTTDFAPTWFVDVTDTIERKYECVALHNSQVHRSYTAESHLYGLAAVHAARIGRPGRYAEAFHVHRMVEC